MKLLVLLTDAFGGRGGIAKFNRDLLNALCAYPKTTEVTALPRTITEDPGLLPDRPRKARVSPPGHPAIDQSRGRP